jgi:peptidoglycan hydrolase-like protein with peptidoglycan-binding domain
MAMDSGDGKSTRRPVLPFVAYAVVLALVGAAAIALWTGRGSLPGGPASERLSPAMSKAAPTESADANRGLKLPPRPAEPEATAPSKQEPAASSAPSQSEASKSDPAAPAAEKPEPPKTTCMVDVGPWPADRTEQAKAVQILLRDLGLYSGTTYGTVGPATREAIRKFQLAAGETETGEPSEMLFEQLKKKKCASPGP